MKGFWDGLRKSYMDKLEKDGKALQKRLDIEKRVSGYNSSDVERMRDKWTRH